MTGAELRQFIEIGLDCGKQTNSLFYNNINLCKDYIEGLRTWKFLIKKQKVLSLSLIKEGNYYYFTAPNDLNELISVNLSSNKNPLEFEYNPRENKILVKLNQPTELEITYKMLTPKITENSSWLFPERFHPILGYLYAAIYKAGVDFDTVNLNNSARLDADFKNFFRMMTIWDDNLKFNELNGLYENQGKYDRYGLPI